MSYVSKVAPFLTDGDFIRNIEDDVRVSDIFIPIKVDEGLTQSVDRDTYIPRLNAYRILPSDVIVLAESDFVARDVKEGKYGSVVPLNITEIDYMTIAKRIETDNDVATILINGAYMKEDIITDIIINSSSNGAKALLDLVDEDKLIKVSDGVNLQGWVNGYQSSITEALLDDMLDAEKSGKGSSIETKDNAGEDFVYNWLDSYFKLPEGKDMKDGDREVVPLMIGPTGVFKSATVKELCRKYNYRMVDFRVTFTSRLDYSGLFQMGEVDGEKFSYACPMEELVTCSDGFREYCRRAYDKVSDILSKGYIIENKSSDGNGVTGDKVILDDVKKSELTKLLEQYKEYMKTPVLFFDEITRCKDAGVEGILVQLLNQKRFENMTMYGCKFVAATNLNLLTGDPDHDGLMEDLDEMYDVNTELDVAYSNRFMPLKVLPNEVSGRWFEWAKNPEGKMLDGRNVPNIHPLIIEFLENDRYRIDGKSLLYNETPVLDAIKNNLNENEKRSKSFPNYRTWEMLSDYLHRIDKEYEEESKENPKAVKMYKPTIINGLISDWAGNVFIGFLISKGYVEYEKVKGHIDDDVGDFLSSSLDAGVPALMIGPSSLGKTSRVKAYINKVEKKTGLRPEFIDVNLASKDVSELMGMPTKQSLVEYVGGSKLEEKGLGEVGKELGEIVKGVCNETEFGLVDTLTRRAPAKTIKDRFKKALDEGREVILFFDECNRVKNPVIMSALFECISDSRFAGVSFKAQKDKVKIIGACNMTTTEMDDFGDDDVEGYANAGSLDPALAARFSVYWKKKYDENDVRSWISYMEGLHKEGKIDGTLLDFFKEVAKNNMQEAIKIIASVEKRKLENAESSTRALLQLSRDIKEMRGAPGPDGFKKSLYNGKLLFGDDVRNKLAAVNDLCASSDNSTEAASKALELINEILSDADVWEPAVIGDIVTVNGKDYSAQDLVDTLTGLKDRIESTLLQPVTDDVKNELSLYAKTAVTALDACGRLDEKISDKRYEIFESYAGENFARKFLPFFNSMFGTENDIEITIEMLQDEKLIMPFVKRRSIINTSLSPEQKVEDALQLLADFWNVHKNTLPGKNYRTLIDCLKTTLPGAGDGIVQLIGKADNDTDEIFHMAESDANDAWIISVLGTYSSQFTKNDIDNMRNAMAGNVTTGRKSRIL